MKISIVLEGYLKDKYSFSPIELNYSKAVTIRKILEEAKISSADVFFIKVEDLIVKEDYFVKKSCKIKLFPIIGGG
jgi:sulfur carrier protein ThiS